MRVQGDAVPGNNGVFYLLGDHLGSTSIVADSSGGRVSELRYRAFGETRFAWGSTPTDYRYTGQREESLSGLYDYGARWYDPVVGRFIQADPIIAMSVIPQMLDRYAYVLNNPIRYADPSGHKACDEVDGNGRCIQGDGGSWPTIPDPVPDTTPKEPWKDEPGYFPDDNGGSIRDWGVDQSDDWREHRAGRMYDWTCDSGGWWGTSCPSPKALAAWLLREEGGSLYNYLTDAEKGPLGGRIMVGAFSYYFADSDGITDVDLSVYTASFNPYTDPTGAFNAKDWEVMNLEPTRLFFAEVDRYWDQGPYMSDGHIVDRWWTSSESRPCIQCVDVLDVYIPVEDVTMFFGYMP